MMDSVETAERLFRSELALLVNNPDATRIKDARIRRDFLGEFFTLHLHIDMTEDSASRIADLLAAVDKAKIFQPTIMGDPDYLVKDLFSSFFGNAQR